MKSSKYIFGFLLLTLFSCSDFLKEYSQDLAYVKSYDDLDELLIGSAYLQPDGEPYYPYLHLLGDEVGEILSNPDYAEDYTGAKENYFGIYTWQKRVEVKPDGTETNFYASDWDRMYEHINLANMVLAEVGELDAENAAEKQTASRIRGEAHFLRAAYYFWLVNLYGQPYRKSTAPTALGVPLKLTEYIEDKTYDRNTVEEVYVQIVKDLDEAETYLKDIPRKSVYRADILAVWLLRSRIALYMQDWKAARTYARKVLEKNDVLVDMNTWQNTQQPFVSKTSPETLFSMGNNNLHDLVYFNVKGYGVSDDLYALYENDLRKTIYFTDEYTVPLCTKYKVPESDLISTSENFTLRTPEAWLNLAEACAYLDEEEEARNALNHLRENRIDRSVYEPIEKSGQELVGFIRDERRRELCLEGHRWFDLRRYSVCEKYPFTRILTHTYSVLDYDEYYDLVPVQTSYYELKPGDPAYTLPIPKETVDYNGMKDNPRNERSAVKVINY